MGSTALPKIKKILPEVEENVSLAENTTFRIGGNARYFFVAKTKDEILRAVRAAKELRVPFFIIGEGSNILVNDKGYGGLIIKIQNSKATLRGVRFAPSKIQNSNIVYAEAGVKLNDLVKLSVEKSLTGLEWAAGIPGTLGGAVYGNVGAFGSAMADVIKYVEVLDTQNLKVNTELSRSIKKLSGKVCHFCNKNSIFKKKKGLIILSVVLQLKRGNKKEIKQRIKSRLDYRKKNHPLGFPSAGCVFKNYAKKITSSKLLKLYPELNEFNKGSRIPTAYLVDKCGLKGKKIGGAKISEKHANFVVNLGGAKSKDVLKLMDLTKRKVKNKFGIKLEEEIQYLN